eukprot:5804236-Prymnesium_polylepis.2
MCAAATRRHLLHESHWTHVQSAAPTTSSNPGRPRKCATSARERKQRPPGLRNEVSMLRAGPHAPAGTSAMHF